MYVRFPILLRNVEEMMFEHGIDVSYETVNSERTLIDHQKSYKKRRTEAVSA